MLSREAEALYWIGRYVERAEAAARRFDVQYHSRLESESAQSATLPWHALLFSSGDEANYRERYGDEEERSLLSFLILDDANLNSIRSCATAATALPTSATGALSLTAAACSAAFCRACAVSNSESFAPVALLRIAAGGARRVRADDVNVVWREPRPS